jgi:predicted nuclease with TOPRIM domain
MADRNEMQISGTRGSSTRLPQTAQGRVSTFLWRQPKKSGTELADAVVEIGELSRSLVQTSMDLAEKANKQRQQILEVVKMEQQTREAATQSEANSRAMAERTETVAQDIDQSSESVEATTHSLSGMVETVTSGVEMMREFVDRMADVNRIVGDIRSIAQQTNLLALNAAIEAAHAGKQGDGFNVIAQEIRELANRAGQSTMKIGDTIARMSSSALTAANAMQQGKQAAETSIEQNRKVQGSFSSIRAAMHEVRTMSAQVAQASERQIAAADKVAGSINEVDAMALESSQESDAAAEMGIKMVSSAVEMQGLLAGRLGRMRANRPSPRSTDRLLEQMREQQAGVEAALRLLEVECAKAGQPGVSGMNDVNGKMLPGLHFGGMPANGAASMVDAVNQRTGCGATIFVADGEKFIRVATNVKLPNGQRATGTPLNPKGMAIAKLRRGESHMGTVYVLGAPFVAAYEPLFSREGKVIGALYAGRKLDVPAQRIR